jgi:hypothetical protein
MLATIDDSPSLLKILTSLADSLLATWEAKRVYSQFAADGASQLDGYLILRQRAANILARSQTVTTNSVPNLISSAWALVMVAAAILVCLLDQEF